MTVYLTEIESFLQNRENIALLAGSKYNYLHVWTTLYGQTNPFDK